jgi:Phage integrase, N-terminal SAM-like domain
MNATPTLPALLESYFTQRLMAQRQASPHTIASYRDTFRLLLNFAHEQCGKSPSSLNLTDLDAPLISAFLDTLEQQRGSAISSRNVRLTAIRSFFRYAAYEEPSQSAHIQRVLAIQNKRRARPMINFLMREEIEALLAAPDQRTWNGRRDHALLRLAVQTGFTSIRGDESRSTGPGVRYRCACSVRWQRTQDKMHAVDETNRRCFEILVKGTGAGNYQRVIPQRPRRAPQFRCRAVLARQIRRHRSATVSDAEQKTSDVPFLEAQFGHGIAGGRCRDFGYCALVGSRKCRNNPDLFARPPRTEGGSACQNQTTDR